jgi:hypothetical protein
MLTLSVLKFFKGLLKRQNSAAYVTTSHPPPMNFAPELAGLITRKNIATSKH